MQPARSFASGSAAGTEEGAAREMTTSRWSTQQLAEFVEAVSAAENEVSAAIASVERAAEALDADVAAIVCEGRLIAAIGYPAGTAPVAQLDGVKLGLEGSLLEVPGVGTCTAAAAPLEHPSGASSWSRDRPPKV